MVNYICMNLTVQGLLRQDARIQGLYLNISEMKLSITSLFSVQIMSYLGASDIKYSSVIDSFSSEILKYKPWILASWRKRSWIVRYTPEKLFHRANFTPSAYIINQLIFRLMSISNSQNDDRITINNSM